MKQSLLLIFGVLVLLMNVTGCNRWLHREPLDYRTLTSDPNHDTTSAKTENEHAVKYLARSQPDKAERSLQKALIADISYGPAHNNLGKLYYVKANYYLAAWEFEYAIKLMPERLEPYNNLGMVYEQAGKLEEAIEAYTSAYKIAPNHPEVLGNLARARLRRGDPFCEIHPLLTDLIFYDTRSEWTQWAKEQIIMNTRSEGQQNLEILPTPSGLQTRASNNISPQSATSQSQSPKNLLPPPSENFDQSKTEASSPAAEPLLISSPVIQRRNN